MVRMKIEVNPEESHSLEIEGKPTFGSIEMVCPHCGETFEAKLDTCYPVLNGVTEFFGDCPHCDEYWQIKSSLTLTVDIDPSKVERQP